MSWDAGAGAGVWDDGGFSNEFKEPATNGFDGPTAVDDGNGFLGGENAGEGDNGARGFSGACFNCGEEGHSKAQCPNPTVEREFTGTCRLCEEIGHRAADCPSKPPQICMNCKEEGHSAVECKSPRKVEYPGVEDVPSEEAWHAMKLAAEERDLDDVMEAAYKYLKAAPQATYHQLEMAFRLQKMGIYLIALEKELSITYTNMDLQGNLDKKYTVTWRFSDKPMRPKERDIWPSTLEENLERLTDAGTPVDRGIPKCNNCDQLGHTFKACPEEKVENADRVVIQCYNCDEVGHRVRDCPTPRVDKFACRNCKKPGHNSKECPEPRSAEGVECNKCNEVGHFSRDCPQGGGGGACHNCGEEGHRSRDCTNPKKLVCRNCDEEGHLSRECPKPKDWSRVQCSNCKKMGHTKVRCKEPIAEEGGLGGDTGGFTGNDASGFAGNDTGAVEFSGGDWEAPSKNTVGSEW